MVVVLRWSGSIAHNVSGLCEVAENRRRKFRFRRHVAKANFYLLIYEKKPIKLAFADYETESFNLNETPPFCKTLVSGSAFVIFYLFVHIHQLISHTHFGLKHIYCCQIVV